MEDLRARMKSLKKNIEDKKYPRIFNNKKELKSISFKNILTKDRRILNRNCMKQLDAFLTRTSTGKFTEICSPTSSSKNSARTYKLDAVKLIDSRVKQFLSKHIRIWRNNAQAIGEAKQIKMKNDEKRSNQSRVTVSLLLLFSRKTSHIYRYFFDAVFRLEHHKETSYKFLKSFELCVYKHCFRQIKTYSTVNLFVKRIEQHKKRAAFQKIKEGKKKIKEVIMFQRDSVFIDDKFIINELRGEVLNQIFTQKLHDIYSVFFKHCKQMIENRSFKAMLHQVSIEKGIRRILNYYKFVQAKAFNTWSKKSNFVGHTVLINSLDRIEQRKKKEVSEVFWLKCMLFIQKKSEITRRIVLVLDKQLRNIFYSVKYIR